MADILSRIDKITEDSSHLSHFFKSWEVASSNGESTMGVEHAVVARETTNQRIIELLWQIYDDIKPIRVTDNPNSLEALSLIIDMITSLADEGYDIDLTEILNGTPGVFGSGILNQFFKQSENTRTVSNPNAKGSRPTAPHSSPKPQRGKRANGFHNGGNSWDFHNSKNTHDKVNEIVNSAFNKAYDDLNDGDDYTDDE